MRGRAPHSQPSAPYRFRQSGFGAEDRILNVAVAVATSTPDSSSRSASRNAMPRPLRRRRPCPVKPPAPAGARKCVAMSSVGASVPAGSVARSVGSSPVGGRGSVSCVPAVFHDRPHTESVVVGTLLTWRLTWTQAPAIVRRSRPRTSTTNGVTSWTRAPSSSRTWVGGPPSAVPSAPSAVCATTRSSRCSWRRRATVRCSSSTDGGRWNRPSWVISSRPRRSTTAGPASSSTARSGTGRPCARWTWG